MVNSKKMSKSSIAVIVLSILLVLSMILGLTGAWFTDVSDSKSTTGSDDLAFGSIGAVTLTLTDATWKNYKDEVVADRTVVMPGDTVTAAGLKIDYSNAGTEDKVYYLIKGVSGGVTTYYTINASSELEAVAAETPLAGEIAKGGSVEVEAIYAKVSTLEVKKDNAALIGNEYQNQALVYADGFSSGVTTYSVAVIQSTNVDNTVSTGANSAYALLAALLG